MNKPWYMSRTIRSAIAKVVAGIGLAINTGDWMPLLLAAFGVYDAYIRFHTNSAIGKADG